MVSTPRIRATLSLGAAALAAGAGYSCSDPAYPEAQSVQVCAGSSTVCNAGGSAQVSQAGAGAGEAGAPGGDGISSGGSTSAGASASAGVAGAGYVYPDGGMVVTTRALSLRRLVTSTVSLLALAWSSTPTGFKSRI
ncbi:hypothetical protein ACFL5O_07620 [Myxococcota bacterium]